MNREAIAPLVIGVVCALAVIFAAATLANPTEQSGTGAGTGGGSGGGDFQSGGVDVDGQNRSRERVPPQRSRAPSEFCTQSPDLTPIALLPALGLAAFGAYVYRSRGPRIAVLSVVVLLVPLVAGYAFVFGPDCPEDNRVRSQPSQNLTNASTEERDNNQSSGGGGDGPAMELPVPILAVVAVGLVGVILATALGRDRIGAAMPEALKRSTVEREEPGEEDVDTGALGRAAGRAADRIETGTDADNEVYRAWVEMTRHLDVDHPHSSTPAEFAAAAVDAGLDPDDVDELTAQFEVVRYGGEAATEERERRAVEALRRIEAEYAEEESDDAKGKPE